MQKVKGMFPLLDMTVKTWTLQNVETQEDNVSEVDGTI